MTDGRTAAHHNYKLRQATTSSCQLEWELTCHAARCWWHWPTDSH